MADKLQQVVDDLAAEHAALANVLHAMTPEQWDIPTHAPGWAVRDHAQPPHTRPHFDAS